MSTNYRHVWHYDPEPEQWRIVAERLTVSRAERVADQVHADDVEQGRHGAAVVALSISRAPDAAPHLIVGARIVPTPAPVQPVSASTPPDLAAFEVPEFHPSSPDDLVPPDLFRTIAYADAAAEQARRELIDAVRLARTAGATWTGIGATLGITRQGASQRFSAAVADLPASDAGSRGLGSVLATDGRS